VTEAGDRGTTPPRPQLGRLTVWLLAGGTALIWLLLADLNWPARLWLAVLLLPLPAITAVQHRYIGDPATLERIPVYLSSMLSLWVMALITTLSARFSGMDAADLGIVPDTPVDLGAWTVALTAVGMGIVFGARALKVPETAFLLRLIPVTARERMIFAGLSVTAGFSEELVFRGFMIHALSTVTGSMAFAIIASTLVFSWMHAYQGAPGAIGAGLLGAMLAVPVAISGSIVPSMLAHATIDVLAGVVFRRRLYDGLA